MLTYVYTYICTSSSCRPFHYNADNYNVNSNHKVMSQSRIWSCPNLPRAMKIIFLNYL